MIAMLAQSAMTFIFYSNEYINIRKDTLLIFLQPYICASLQISVRYDMSLSRIE